MSYGIKPNNEPSLIIRGEPAAFEGNQRHVRRECYDH